MQGVQRVVRYMLMHNLPTLTLTSHLVSCPYIFSILAI
jgi:hypothetical protein